MGDAWDDLTEEMDERPRHRIRLTITEILEQTEIWQCADGMPIRLERMEPSHRRNTLAFLRRRAHTLHDHMFWSVFAMAPDDVFEQAITEDPAQWLERQPFIARLAELVIEDEKAEEWGDVIDCEFWEAQPGYVIDR